MKRSDFHYELPAALIAQYPLAERAASRLLVMKGDGGVEDRMFSDLPSLLGRGDLLVFNDTRVIPARLFARKTSGGRVEILVERLLDGREILAQVRSSKPLREGGVLLLAPDAEARVEGREGAFYRLSLQGVGSVMEILERIGHVPLPPYIERQDESLDRQRYQTVFARREGAVAAPTAGLHFDEVLLEQLRGQGVNTAFVTLHVGAGTFQPLRVEDIGQHRMHEEYMEVSREVCEQVEATRRDGGRVVAVGTTVVRCLETAARSGRIAPFSGSTDIFITPGHSFACVDALVTNFHMPESTLLMLVCAFGGMDRVLSAYRHAVEEKYRFFSYGDAMFLEKPQS
ncbi:MAG TPA: tRNA preQ1(34) S-adenosylmethionine ribosyltransferase-isomerase QueA [Gammaproteobacteria bacterium]|nr:tRNA preQ1(34) S-adenosylmethionine ribosyltransferase-isomerase QueA [Gammaproteobacteria bacterium]